MERGLQKINRHRHLAEWNRRVEVCLAEVPVRPAGAEMAAGDRWAGGVGADAVPAGSIPKRAVPVLRTAEDHLLPVYEELHRQLVEREALNALPPDKREGTAALTGLEYCNQLFAWEDRFKKLSPEERAKQRLKEGKPILDALLVWQIPFPLHPSPRWAKPYTMDIHPNIGYTFHESLLLLLWYPSLLSASPPQYDRLIHVFQESGVISYCLTIPGQAA